MHPLQNQVSEFPLASGVYLMKDASLKIIYVGKAKNLKNRVQQYLNLSDKRPQITFLMARVTQIDFIVTHSEKDALLLENSLIKKHKPKYNVFLKDDKTYMGLKLTVQHPFAQLLETRKIKSDGSQYYGPFTSAEHVRDVKNFIYKFFMLRTCSDHEFAARTRPCLEYQIKRCSAPCVGLVSADDYQKQIQEVRQFLEGKNQNLKTQIQTRMHTASESQNFEEAARLRDLLTSMDVVLDRQQVTQLSFDFVDLIAIERVGDKIAFSVLMVRDATLIDSKFFELGTLEDLNVALQNFITQYYSDLAFIPKEIITTILPSDVELLTQLLSERAGRKVAIRMPHKGEKRELLQLAHTNLHNHLNKKNRDEKSRLETLQSLQAALELPQLPARIECYDISNISGKFAVGSMVVFVDGRKATSEYKKFKIKSLDSPNDFAMMFEVLKRRFGNDWPLPDLLLVDGGKGQITQAQKILRDLNLESIFVAGIAKGQGQGKRAKGVYDQKKNDEIYVPGRKNPLKFKATSPEIMLLQNVRDEAHRFAIGYHRKLRDKALTHSWLDDVPGLGLGSKQALLKAFGSPQAVAQATVSEWQSQAKISKKIATNLATHLQSRRPFRA